MSIDITRGARNLDRIATFASRDGGLPLIPLTAFDPQPEAVKLLPRVIMTIVDLQHVDESEARNFVEKEIGAIFLKRPFF